MVCRKLVSLVAAAGVCVLAAGCSQRRGSAPANKERKTGSSRPAGATEPAAIAESGKLSAPKARTRAIDGKHRATAQRLINGGVGFLLARRGPDGSWSLPNGANKPAVTALVLKALVQHPDFNSASPVVKHGFRALLEFRRAGGGIYNPKEGQANYTTAVAVMAMVAVGDPRFSGAIREAVRFMRGRQITPGCESPDGQGITKDHPFMGGVSYGRHGRPDLSNVGMWVEALRDAGVEPDDPAMKNVIVFVSRTQNRSESNPLAWAKAGGSDGGFAYAPAIRGNLQMGESKAGPGPGSSGLRSYGSMTYVGFKSLLYAGVDRGDPRVRAAYQWIRRHWRLDSNPNMPQISSRQGLYYYYHVFGKALRAWGEDVITDAKGVKHNWREELISQLGRLVREDGSWVNQADRWYEGYPNLVTAYAVLALQEAMKR